MKRFAKLILVALAAVIGLGVVVLVGINLYLQSKEVQSRIRIATARALGTPVEVKRTLFTPWSGLILSGLSMPDPIVPNANLMEAPSFSLRFELLPLLQKRFIISEISLESPALALRQNDEGKWVVREEPEKVPPAREPAGPREPGVERPGREAPPQNVPEFTVELEKFRVSEGEAAFYDRRGRRIGQLTGVNIEGTVDAQNVVIGTLRIHEMEFAGQLHPKRLRAEFESRDQKLSITEIKCALAGGSIRAEFFAVIPKKRSGKPEFAFKGEIDDVSIPTLISEAHGDDAGTSGTVVGALRLEGNPTDEKSIVGGGEFALIDAKIRPVDFIRQVGTLFGIDELRMLDLQQATLNVEVNDARVWVNDLTLKTDNLILAGSGPVRFNGKMDIDGRLLINEKLEKRLAGVIAEKNFLPSEDANYKELTFHVKGRLNRPETDLLDRLTGLNIGKFGGFLGGLLQAPGKSKKDKDSDDD